MKNELKELERKIRRLEEQIRVMEKDHEENKDILNYHSGYSLGYLRGKSCELDNRLDDMREKEITKG